LLAKLTKKIRGIKKEGRKKENGGNGDVRPHKRYKRAETVLTSEKYTIGEKRGSITGGRITVGVAQVRTRKVPTSHIERSAVSVQSE